MLSACKSVTISFLIAGNATVNLNSALCSALLKNQKFTYIIQELYQKIQQKKKRIKREFIWKEEHWSYEVTTKHLSHIPRHWVVWLIPFKSQYWLFSAISRNTPQPQRATLKSAWILQELLRFPKPKQMGLSPCQPLGYHAGSSWLPIFLLRNLTEKKAKTKTQHESKSALLSLDLSVKDQ